MRAQISLSLSLSAVAAYAFVACQSSEGAQPTSADASVISEGGDGGAPGVPDAAGDATEGASTGDLGTVFALSDSITVDGGARAFHRAGAFFSHRTATGTSTTSRVEGPCVVETEQASGTSGAETPLSAGAIHIQGGALPITLVPDVDKTYAPVTGSVSLWAGGEAMTVSGEGKDVPAFTASLVAPQKLTVQSPSLPTVGGILTVSKKTPWSATWSGAQRGLVVLYFDAATSVSASSATCTFNAADGKGEVPAAALSTLATGLGSFNFYAKEVATASPNGFPVRVTLSRAMVDTQGAGASGNANFE